MGWKSLLRFWQRQGQGLFTLAHLPRDGFEQTTPKSTTPSPLQTMITEEFAGSQLAHRVRFFRIKQKGPCRRIKENNCLGSA